MKASGFAASNGTGPHGEKCKTCNFCQHRWQVFKLIRVKSWHPDYTKQQKYFCTLTKGQINSTAAACALWEKKDE